MDFNHNTGLLVLAGTSAQNEPEIVKYQAEAGCLRHTGAAKVQRTDVRLTHVRFLANSEKVVAGEVLAAAATPLASSVGGSGNDNGVPFILGFDFECISKRLRQPLQLKLLGGDCAAASSLC